jgi:hypothetical protein
MRGVWLDRGELDKIIERSVPAAPPPQSPPQRGYDDDSGYRKKRAARSWTTYSTSEWRGFCHGPSLDASIFRIFMKYGISNTRPTRGLGIRNGWPSCAC